MTSAPFRPSKAQILKALQDKKAGKPLSPQMEKLLKAAQAAWDKTSKMPKK